MALTRKMLKAMGIEDEKIDQIIEAHTETVDGLKEELTAAKDSGKALPALQKKLEDLETELEAAKKDGWKDKHDSVKRDFDAYKRAQEAKETQTAKGNAYRALLKAAGVSEKRLETILKVTDLDKVELEDGKIKDADKLTAAIKEEWGDFIVKTEASGASTATPPANGGGGTMTKEQILSIRDGAARRKAMAEHPQLFGLPVTQS